MALYEITKNILGESLADKINDHFDMGCLLDFSGNIIFMTDSVSELLGDEYLDYIGKHFEHTIHPEDIELFKNTFFSSSKLRQGFTLSYRVKTSKGYKRLNSSAFPIPGKDLFFLTTNIECIELHFQSAV